ncbi:MAG: hypothetical protein ABJC04_00580 [Verrucomicrobiota bacterium]
MIFIGAWFARKSGFNSPALDWILLFSAAMATLAVFCQQMPVQNAVGLSLTIAIFSGITLFAGAVLRESFFPPLFNHQFALLPAWMFPLLWLIALINARAIAKLICRSARKTSFYGYGLLLLAALLAAGFQLGVQFSGKNFLTQFVLAAAALTLATPWFIDKKNAEEKMDVQPLLMIFLLFFW